MAIAEKLAKRWEKLMASPSLLIVPVGDLERVDRGILSASDKEMSSLKAAVKATFSAVVIAAAMATAMPSHAAGVGYDAGVYGQAQGQVMQQGNATRMIVLDARPVRIEVAPQMRGSGQGTGAAVMAASSAVGALVGNQLGKSSGGQQIGTILGGLAGLVAGNLANNAMQSPPEPSLVDGVEVTMLNPATNQVVAITQAGSQVFARNDPVLVVMTGGTARVIPDRSQQLVQNNGYRPAVERMSDSGRPVALLQGPALERTLASVMHSAKAMGLQVDANKVASLLETGVGEREGMFIGKVTGIDPVCGVVFQSTGRGMGVVHSMNALSRVPAIGEIATIKMHEGRGMVNDGLGQGMAQGFGR